MKQESSSLASLIRMELDEVLEGVVIEDTALHDEQWTIPGTSQSLKLPWEGDDTFHNALLKKFTVAEVPGYEQEPSIHPQATQTSSLRVGRDGSDDGQVLNVDPVAMEQLDGTASSSSGLPTEEPHGTLCLTPSNGHSRNLPSNRGKLPSQPSNPAPVRHLPPPGGRTRQQQHLPSGPPSGSPQSLPQRPQSGPPQSLLQRPPQGMVGSNKPPHKPPVNPNQQPPRFTLRQGSTNELIVIQVQGNNSLHPIKEGKRTYYYLGSKQQQPPPNQGRQATPRGKSRGSVHNNPRRGRGGGSSQ